TGIPEGVPLSSRLKDPGAGATYHHFIAEQCTEGSGQDIGKFIFVMVVVQRGGQGSRRDRMMDNGKPFPCIIPFHFPLHSEATEIELISILGENDFCTHSSSSWRHKSLINGVRC